MKYGCLVVVENEIIALKGDHDTKSEKGDHDTKSEGFGTIKGQT